MFGKLKNVIQEEGIKGIVKKIKNRVVKEVYSYKLDLSTIKEYPDEAFIFTPLTEKVLDEMYQQYSSELIHRKYQLLKERLDQKSPIKAYVILDNKKHICGYTNFAVSDFFDSSTNSIIKLKSDEAFFMDDYTFLSHRKRGVQTFAFYSRFKLAKEKNYKWSLINVQKGHPASEKLMKKFGFKKYKRFLCIKAFGYKKTFVKEVKG